MSDIRHFYLRTICHFLTPKFIKQMNAKDKNFLILIVMVMWVRKLYLSQRQHYLTIVLKRLSSNVMLHNKIMKMLFFTSSTLYIVRKQLYKKRNQDLHVGIKLSSTSSFIFFHGARSKFSHPNSFGCNFPLDLNSTVWKIYWDCF